MLDAIEITSQASPSNTHAGTGSILRLINQGLAVYTLKGVKDVVGNSSQLSQHLGDTGESEIQGYPCSIEHSRPVRLQETLKAKQKEKKIREPQNRL